MNSLTRFRTGISLGMVAAATLVGCGDDDSAPVTPGSDAGDGGAQLTDGETDPDPDTTTDEMPPPVETSEGETSVVLDAGVDTSWDASTPADSSETVTTDAAITEATTTDATAQTSDVASQSGESTDVATSEETSDVETSSDAWTGGADSGVVDSTNSTGEGALSSTGPISETETGDIASTSDDSTAPVVDWIGLEVGDAVATSVSVEPQGNDGYLSVVYDADGNFYAVGSATDASGDSYMAVTKFFGDGTIDSNFGQNGVARKNVSAGGAETVRAITLQTTGTPATTYIVIAGTAQFQPTTTGLAAAEQDVAIVRFTMGGTVDGAFGSGGVVRLDLNSGIEGLDRNGNPAWVGNDAVWSLGITQGDKLVVHGEQRTELVTELEDGGTAPRSDVDWTLIRLLADGTLDDSFGDGGKVTLDLLGAGASARSATVLEDGSIIGTGYLTSEVLGASTQQPVLYKVDQYGAFDVSFATEDAWGADGVFHDYVVATDKRAEAYGAAVQGTHLVTMGYGPTTGTGTGTDFVALRFTAEGAHDKTFGVNGVTYIDAAGQSDNGRSLVILPDQTILGIGGGRHLLEDGTTAVSDGMLVLLTPDGLPIQSFGEKGLRLYELGGSNDFFWAGAVAPDHNSVAIVGIKGATGSGDDADTDGAVLVLPLSHFSN